MGRYFDDIHASCKTELCDLPCDIADSKEVAEARADINGFDGYVELGKALSRQLRYREAAEAFSKALDEKPDEPDVLRLRAGRYLSTLQTEKARADLEKCLALGGEALDLHYRLGLCDYYAANYRRAMRHFEVCRPLADDEMGIAAIYWHTLCSYRCGEPASLLSAYHTGMKVGHHFAYEKAVRVCAGDCSIMDMLSELADECEDLHYTITAYGLSLYLDRIGRNADACELIQKVLERDSFWPCYAYLAAWNDGNRR